MSVVRVLSISTALLAGGCILLVSPETGGPHCRFAGADTTCGSCIASRCQDAVDGICAPTSPLLGALEACSTGRGSECTTLLSDTGSPEATALSSCARQWCSGACATPAPASPKTACRPEAFGDGRACFCSLSDQPNTYVCAEAFARDVICCAPDGWPSTGLECRCRPLDCAPNTNGCSCTLSGGVPTTERCSAERCCISEGYCRCGDRECAGTERSVTECSMTELGCPIGTNRVSSCTL